MGIINALSNEKFFSMARDPGQLHIGMSISKKFEGGGKLLSSNKPRIHFHLCSALAIDVTTVPALHFPGNPNA